MSLNRFLLMLFDHGRVEVCAFAPIEESDQAMAMDQLERVEATWRLNAPGQPPEFDAGAAIWGATLFYRCSQFAVQREIDSQTITETFQSHETQWHEFESPAAHYSVDLTLRFLPDMANLVAGFAAGDPLVGQIQKIGERWPLSSVGIQGIGNLDMKPLTSSDCLMQMYVDRVLSRKDESRADNDITREWIQRTLGYHLDLAGAFKLVDNNETEVETPNHE